MLDVLAYALLGIGLGVFTGLVPGIHVNNLTPMLVALALSSSLPPMRLVATIAAMALTHTFISYIPATFLGAPEQGTELSVLPAHRLLLEGHGYKAIELTAFGCLSALMLGAALVLPLSLVVEPAYRLIQPQMHWLLIAIIAIMVALERSRAGIFWAAAIFLLSGLLGLLTLDTNLCRGDAALMPLLSRLFGASVLLVSAIQKSSLPEQYIGGELLGLRPNVRPLCAGTAAGILTGFIPGIGPSQGTVLAQLATRSSGTNEFLVAVSGVNTAKTLFSFVALYAIGRPRSGAAVAVDQLIEVGLKELIFLVGVALLAGGVAAVLHLKLGKLAAKHIGRLPYRAMCIVVIASIVGLTVCYSGLIGLPVLTTATAIGLLPATTKVKRTHCMGVIMVPCILYFAGLKDGMLAALGL
ncbi:MAG: tripartite tricarboxylate transporter permease [Candidatus Hodarchaeaceae archaeon]|nr:tripartite tricarboxylate transporter permease [Candidatus Hodarchaeaceae archaeon]